MYSVTLRGPNDVHLESEPAFAGPLQPGHVVLRTIATALSSGTELAAVTARYGTPFYGWPFDYPSNLGYLNVGSVTDVGAGVTDVALGDVLYTFRQHRGQVVFPVDEPHWHVPRQVDPAVASFAYLISLAAHGLRRANLVPGETVAVVGLGAVGLGAVAMARQFGSPVIAIDPIATRRSLATALGATKTLDPGKDAIDDIAADVVLEAAGTGQAIDTALSAVRTEGRIAVVALHPTAGQTNPLGRVFYEKQVALISTSFQSLDDLPGHQVRFNLQRGVQDVLDRLTTGQLDFGPAVTHRISYRDLPATYARLTDGSLEAGAIAVLWP